MDCVRTGPHPQRTGEPADPLHCNALNIFPCARFFHQNNHLAFILLLPLPYFSFGNYLLQLFNIGDGVPTDAGIYCFPFSLPFGCAGGAVWLFLILLF